MNYRKIIISLIIIGIFTLNFIFNGYSIVYAEPTSSSSSEEGLGTRNDKEEGHLRRRH